MPKITTDKKDYFLQAWKALEPDAPMPVTEYNFDGFIGRRHRFDFAWIDYKVAVEINGNAWNVRGGGRHGNDADLEKLNLAASMGWSVFQFSPRMIETDPIRWISMVRRAVVNRMA